MLPHLKQQLKNILQYAITTALCVAIIVFGISFLSKAADPVTTSIGENISTNDFIAYSNATTTLNHYIGGALITATTTLNGVTYVWPSSDGSSGQALTTNNDGTVSWISLSGAVGSLKYGAVGSLAFYSADGTTATGTAASLIYWDDTSGNLGIGTSSPYAKLSVVGETVAEYFTATSTTATSTFPYLISTQSNVGTVVGGTWQGTAIGDAYLTKSGDWTGTIDSIEGAGLLRSNASDEFETGNTLTITGTLDANGAVSFADTTVLWDGASTDFGFIGDWTVNTNDMTILNSSGNVGIGTSSPYAKLSVWGDGTSGATAFNVVNSASTTLFSILDSGFVGIGTTSPYAKLSVVGEIVAEYFTATSTTATSTFLGGLNISGGQGYNDLIVNSWITANDQNANKVIIGSLPGADAFPAIFFGSGVPSVSNYAFLKDTAATILQDPTEFQISINNNVNFSITDGAVDINPNQRNVDFKVTGNLTDDIFVIDAETEEFLWTGNNVGIGTTSPYAKLSVVGQIVAEYFTATSTTATSTFAFNIGSPSGGFTIQSAGTTNNILLNPYGGKVGVASSSPFATFAVEQQDNDTIVFLVADSGTSTPHLKIDGAGITTIGQLQTGAMSFDANAGMLSWVNMPVDSSVASNTIQSFTAQIDSNNILTIYALSDGVGGVTYPSVGIGTTTPTEQFSVANRMYIGGTGTSTIENNLYVMGTLRSAVQYVGDLIFANNFRFTESQPVDESPRALILKSHTLDDLLYIDEDGNMGIGTTTPAVALTVQGDAMADSWLTYEVVEMDLFPENDKDVFEEGDLLSISDETGGFVKASSYDNYPIIGIAKEVNLWNSSSTKPAILGTFTAKVSTENGDIYIGDYLTKSSIDGVAMRADVGDQTVGFALEDYYGTGIEIIKVFINVDKPGGGGESESIASESYSAGSDFSISDFFDTMLYKLQDLGLTIKNGIVQAREFVADKITAKQITTEKLCLDDLCINKDKLQEILDKNQILGTEEDVNLPAEPENLDEPLVNEEDDDTGEEENDSGGAKSEENNTDEDGKVAGEEESAGNDAVETEESSSTGGEEPPPEEVVE